MSHAIYAPACALFDLPDVHVRAVERGPRSLTVVAETFPTLVGCPSCGVIATSHGRRKVLLRDLPGVDMRRAARAGGVAREDLLVPQGRLQAMTFNELHELAAPRTKLATRAVACAVAQLRSHDIYSLNTGRGDRGRLEHRLGRNRSGRQGPAGRPGPVRPG